jgi:cell division protein FtsW (lipid II flippase)
MGVTSMRARQRDGRQAASAARLIGAADLLLLSTSLAGLLAIGLAYAGQRHRAAVSTEAGSAVRVTNLNAVADAGQLEPALDTVMTNPADRRFAARELFRFVAAGRDAGRRLPNVEAILGASVPVAAIEGTPRPSVYIDRLRVARENAARAGRAAPATLGLLTSADLAAIKPALVVRTPAAAARAVVIWGTVYVLAFYAVVVLWRVRAVRGDRLLLATAHLLTALGFAALLTGADPLRDTLLFIRYTVGVLVGLGVMGALSLVDFRKTAFLKLSYVPLLGALFLSMLLIVFGRGPGTSGAKVNLGPVQPIEAIRLLLALFLAGYFARRWELLRQMETNVLRWRRLPVWPNVPRAGYVGPVVVGVGTALAFFFLQKDLGPALFLSCVFLVLYAVSRGRLPMAIAGVALLAAGFYIGYRLNISDTLAARVQMWQSPWDNGVRGGDQVSHAVWALATGGFFGTGLGLGGTRYLPAGHTDLPLAAVGEELGFVGLLVVLAAYAVMNWRGFRIGIAASTDYGFFLATAVTLFLVIPVLVMSAGILGLIPLTGVVTPFLSYGGSAMTANFAALGILSAIPVKRRSVVETAEPFRGPVRYLGAALGAAAVGLVGVLLSVQLVNADEYAVKPHFGIQADGVGRYQYNPRVLDLVRKIPRGSVYDRTGLALATGDPTVAERSRGEYLRSGITPDSTCTAPIERCYPLGGPAFHLLGESSTRLNWSATNASYVERDADPRLRGFDDHATTVRPGDVPGRSAVALRRDYRELIPLLRHRYDPQHAAVQTLLDRNRDIRLTVDARLQLRLATILASAAKQSATGKAAAAVLDPDTGNLLAVASYPWPVLEGSRTGAAMNAPDVLLDRARFGLYPPGSTFKLVTAIAAFRRDLALSSRKFTCSRLPDGRVGARIPGSRTVRDDVLDKHPHGTIDMHDGLVHSCNAYFAQLAQGLGPEPLLDTAAALGISVAPSNSMQRLRATLPQAGYGQGDVVVTPLRMARVAAALASDGILREPRWDAESSAAAEGDVLLPPEAARQLARYMRDAVVSGTGRSLRGHAWRIAGKTGTAEVAHAASHSWFVGFAPYGPATRRVAFAVIIENAGYGSLAAAPVAGEIVSAAAAAGLVK